MNIRDTVSRLKGLIALGLTALIAVSCNDVNFNGPKTNKAHMNVHLTDAPANYQEVNVDVQGMRVFYMPMSTDTASVDSARDGKWVDLPVKPMTINLLDLTNGVDTLLSSADLKPGRYSEMRLILGSDNTVMVDSMTHNLKVPSGQHSGYKIKFGSIELKEGQTIDISVDFDASRSVHQAGKSGKYILHPVLRAFVESGDQVETGSITGTVEPSDSNADILAIMGEDTTSTQADTTGGFMLQGLDPGQYNLTIQPTNDQYSDTTLTDVSVEKGQETDVGTITLSGNQ